MTTPTTVPGTGDDLGWADLIAEAPGEYRLTFASCHGGRHYFTDRVGCLYDADVLAGRIAEPLPELAEDQVWQGTTCIASTLRGVVTDPRLAEAIAEAWTAHTPAAVDVGDVLAWTGRHRPDGRVAITADRRRGVVVEERTAAVIDRLGYPAVLGPGRWGWLIADTARPPRVVGIVNLGEPHEATADAILTAITPTGPQR